MNALAASGLATLFDLATQTEQNLMRSPNLGRKSLAEIKDVLAAHGLALGTMFPEVRTDGDSPAQGTRKHARDPKAAIRKSLRNAYRWYRELAEQGCPSAHNLLGYMHYTGRGTSKSRMVAADHFAVAARLGHALAAQNHRLCLREPGGRA
jgi:TPR repeat protein